MEQDHPLPNSPAFADLVVRTIDDVDGQTDTFRDALLADLLSACWGSVVAQNQ
jgi:hypothetical protein